MAVLRAVETPIPSDDADLKRFLCERYWLPVADYPLCSDLFRALGLTGDDCHEFMTDFSTMFRVDLTEFVWPKFHLAEDEAQDVRAALRPLMRFAGLKTQPLNRDLIPLSIDHLAQVAKAGRWFDPQPDVHGKDSSSLGQSFARFSARLKAGGIPRTRSR